MQTRDVAYRLTTERREYPLRHMVDLRGSAPARVDESCGIYRLPIDLFTRTDLQRAAAGEVDGRPITRWARVVGSDPHLRLFTGPA